MAVTPSEARVDLENRWGSMRGVPMITDNLEPESVLGSGSGHALSCGAPDRRPDDEDESISIGGISVSAHERRSRHRIKEPANVGSD